MNKAQIDGLAQQIVATSDGQQIMTLAREIIALASEPDPVPVPPPDDPTASIRLYVDDRYTGRSLLLMAATPNLDPLGFNDLASSAVVVGTWEVWTDANYTGQKVVLAPGSYPSMRPFGINDAISSCRPVGVAPPAPVPAPGGGRRYMISFGGSPDPVCAYENLRFLPCWGTTDINQMVDEFRRTKALGVNDVALNLDWLCWSHDGRIPVTYLGTASAMGNLRTLFDALLAADLLSMVRFIWLPDEPGRDSKISDADMRRFILDATQLATEYPDLTGVRFAAIWGYASDPRPAADLVHVQGIDNYDKGAGVLSDIDDLERGLQPWQYTMTVPGMYDSEGKPKEIEAFLPYMQQHPRNLMMCVFLYDSAQKGYGFNGTASRVMAVANAVKAIT